MNTKTLLIAAATLAVGAISSQAQVYSLNVVGYVNTVVPAGHYQIISSQMIGGSDTAQTNGDINATMTNGFISTAVDPTTSTNTKMFYWTGSAYKYYYFYNSADATTWINDGTTYPAGWYDTLQSQATATLANGQSCFILNRAAIPLTNTCVGNVFQGTNVVLTIKTGYNLISLLPAISTNLCVDASGNQLPFGLPPTMTSQSGNPTKLNCDYLSYWTGTSYQYFYYFNSADATTWINDGTTYPGGFYDSLQSPMSVNPNVNQGFFLHHIGSPINWTNTFSVQ